MSFDLAARYQLTRSENDRSLVDLKIQTNFLRSISLGTFPLRTVLFAFLVPYLTESGRT